MDISRSSSPAHNRRNCDQATKWLRRGGSTACRGTWRSGMTISKTSGRSKRAQAFSDRDIWPVGTVGQRAALLVVDIQNAFGQGEALGGPESALHELSVDELFICGLATDYCVRATALDGVRRGLTIRVLRDAIRGVEVKRGDSENAIKEMRGHGAHFSETRGLAKLLPKS